MSKAEDQNPESVYESHLEKIFAKFDEKEAKLDLIPGEAVLAVNKVIDSFNKDGFTNPDKFRKNFDAFSRRMGHTHHTVMEIELQRQKLSQPVETLTMLQQPQREQREVETALRPVVVNAAAQPTERGSPGFWGWLEGRTKWRTLEKMSKPEVAQITTANKPKDFLDYCRDVTGECNKFYDYYQQTLDHLHFFHDESTKLFYKGQIRTFLGKLCNIVVSFSQAIVEYRKELNSWREIMYGQAYLAMKTAEYQSEHMPRGISPMSPPSYPLGSR
jgi:hypothetical protein